MTITSKVLKVIGEQTMHCSGCERTVEFTLKQLPGVRQVDASHKTQLINLTFDTGVLDMERVHRELDWIGYQVTEAEVV